MNNELVEHFHPDRNADKAGEKNGATYLRALKESGGGDNPAVANGATGPNGVERRRDVRYRCNGSVQFRTEGTEIRTWGTLSDVSLHGCYVEMTATYPVGTVVELGLEVAGVRVDVTGEVRVSYPYLGMGISFRELPIEEKERLREMLRRLSSSVRSVVPTQDVLGSDGIPIALPTFASAGELVKELGQYFEAHGSLTRDEFHRMARRWAETR